MTAKRREDAVIAKRREDAVIVVFVFPFVSVAVSFKPSKSCNVKRNLFQSYGRTTKIRTGLSLII